MDWIRAHPYASTLAGAGFLIIIGVFVVERHAAVTPVTQPSAWGGISGISTNPAYTPNTTQNTQPVPEQLGNVSQNTSAPVFTYPQSSGNTPDGTSQTSTGSFNFDALIALMSKSAQSTSSGSANTSTGLLDAYTLIPQGLISTTTPVKRQTAAQAALYGYGNEAGSTIQSFEETHTNMSQVLTDQVNDRTDTQKAAAVVSIGNGLAAMGRALEGITDAPPSVVSLNLSLAKSYEDIGAKLAQVPQAQTDAQFITAIDTYNAAADTFTKNYVALASYLAASGVTFSPNDPGDVFSFTDASL